MTQPLSRFRVAYAGAARRTRQIVAGALLDHENATLIDIRNTGYVAYWVREYVDGTDAAPPPPPLRTPR